MSRACLAGCCGNRQPCAPPATVLPNHSISPRPLLCRYALGNMGRIWTESAHSVGRKATLTLEFMYLTINLIFGTW